MSSDGWNRPKPRFSHRREPLTLTPHSATAREQHDPQRVERHRGARDRLRRNVGDDPHQEQREGEARHLAPHAREALVRGREQRDEADARRSSTRPPAGSCRRGATGIPTRGPESVPSVALVFRFGDRNGRRRSRLFARRPGHSRTPAAQSAPPPAHRSRRSRPARRARCAACRPAHTRYTTRGRAAARRPGSPCTSRPSANRAARCPVLPALTYADLTKAAALVPSLLTPTSAFLITARCSGFTCNVVAGCAATAAALRRRGCGSTARGAADTKRRRSRSSRSRARAGSA